MTDSQLIQQIVDNQAGAFKNLVDAYYPMVLKTAHGLLHNREDAEDICQDVFVELYQSIKKFRGESKLFTWIYRITVNKSLNYLRKRKRTSLTDNLESFVFGRRRKGLQDEATGYFSESNPKLENEEQACVLHKAIDKLPRNQKIAFTLSKYDDLPNKDVAQIMNVSLSAVESLIHRAKLNLQKSLISYYKAS